MVTVSIPIHHPDFPALLEKLGGPLKYDATAPPADRTVTWEQYKRARAIYEALPADKRFELSGRWDPNEAHPWAPRQCLNTVLVEDGEEPLA